MIRFEQVGKRYANGHVGLHELSFRVRRGEFLFVTRSEERRVGKECPV